MLCWADNNNCLFVGQASKIYYIGSKGHTSTFRSAKIHLIFFQLSHNSFISALFANISDAYPSDFPLFHK